MTYEQIVNRCDSRNARRAINNGYFVDCPLCNERSLYILDMGDHAAIGCNKCERTPEALESILGAFNLTLSDLYYEDRLDYVLDRLSALVGAYARERNGSFILPCPICDTGKRKQRLSVAKGIKGVILKCFKCSDRADNNAHIKEILHMAGIPLNRLYYEAPVDIDTGNRKSAEFPFVPSQVKKTPEGQKPQAKEKTARGERTTRYHVYRSADGKPIAKKEIYRYENGDKTASWFKMNEETGRFNHRPGLDGAIMPLYRLDYLSASKSKSVIVVEGEKDADTIWEISNGKVPATSLPNGAGQSWLPHYASPFSCKNVVIIHDNDTPGEGYAEMIASNLQYVADRIKVINAGDLFDGMLKETKGADVTDILHAIEANVQDAKTASIVLWNEIKKAVKEAPEYFEFCPDYEEAQEGGEQE